MSTVPSSAQPRVYPLPAPADDRRFTLGLVFDVAKVLVEHGFPPITSGGDLVALQQALYGFLYTADPTGYGYSRPADPVDVTPIPAHVEGHPTTGRDDGGFAERLLPSAVTRAAATCPDWCTVDHTGDDKRDDLITHMGDDHTNGTVRKLLDGTFDIRVARTDCEGTAGTPNLYVRCELELTTWEQVAKLARTILDGFGYLNGADQ